MNPTIADAHTADGSRSGVFTSSLTGLQNGILYYIRAYATNALGTVYGGRVNLTTKTIPVLTTIVPTVSTAEPGVISSGGTVSSDGGAAVTVRGICWSATNATPDINGSHTSDGTGSGIFTSIVNGLDASKTIMFVPMLPTQPEQGTGMYSFL